MVEKEKPLNTEFRVKIQGLIESNTIRSGGDFHVDELDEDNFIRELINNFKLIPRDPIIKKEDALYEAIKKSTKKVRGMINCKEFKQNIFLKRFHENFKIQNYDNKRRTN